ncbi:MAG TPA: hypothetical protein PLC79_10130, partial [Phycisphaerae bacterium]|nr:hypothetical protein [Phycisphaerae bacterium]
MPAERHVRLAREGQRPADGEVRGSVTETSWRNVVHFNKSWVLGLDWPAGRPGPFIVARSEPADSSEAARQAAERDARRQLAERLRAQVAQAVAVDRYLGRTEPLFADGLSVNTDLLRQQADELRAQAEQVAAYARGTAEATPVRMDEILSGTDTLLREAGRLVAQAQEMGASARDQRASRAVAEARSQAAAVQREAELLRVEAQRTAAAARTTVDAVPGRRDARAVGGDRTSVLRQQAEKLREAAQRTEARARDLSGRTAAQADRLTESIDAAATAAVSSGASRLDEFLQPLDASSGRRWLGAVLIDASPSAMDALAARVIAPPAPEAPRTADRPHRFYTIGVLLLMIILAYAFLAAGRYAFFKWPVRVAVAGAFAALCVMAMHFSEGLSAAADGRAAQTALSRAVSIFRPSPSLAERLVALAQTSADGVATAVATAESTEMDDARLKPLDLLVCGEYRIVGGDAVGAIKAIEQGIRRGGCENWYQKSLGLARLRAGQVSEARRAFARAAGDADAWRRRPVANGSLDAWTAAYFLDLVSQAEYTNNTARDDRYACFPWFYVGQRMEIEGERDKAIAAYRKSVELGERSGAH